MKEAAATASAGGAPQKINIVLNWKILHQGVRYEERGPAVVRKRKQQRAAKMIRDLRSLGYRVEFVGCKS